MLIAGRPDRIVNSASHRAPANRSEQGRQVTWKTDYISFYYEDAPEPDEIAIDPASTALLMVDLQNTYMTSARQHPRWADFGTRMDEIVIPNASRIIDACRRGAIEVLHARIACRTDDGRDRSLSQKRPGFNNLLLPMHDGPSQLIDAVAPVGDEICVIKTTDSALTGTNLRLILHNLGIRTVIVAGIFTDQCISSTVRSLADESFDVFLVHDACAAGTMELHNHELAVLNRIYCQVLGTGELLDFIACAGATKTSLTPT
ncbi:MAG: cysteine hydrolase family protein [Paracoccaceae bacterium]